MTFMSINVCDEFGAVVGCNTYAVDTVEEVAEAQAAMREAGLASAPVYVGEPDGLGDSYPNGQVVFA